MMRHLQKKQVKYALSFVGISVFCYGLYKAYQYLNKRKQPSSIITNVGFDAISQQQKQALSFISKSSQHTPYENIIQDNSRQNIKAFKVAHLENIHQIQYKIILSLAKGNSYQGIVNITFLLDSIPDTEEYFKINFNGGGVKYANINGKCLEQTQFQYKNHQILFPKDLFKFKSKNNIEIIFQNMYSFLNYGLSSYFLVDQHQKYSLRQQVIYSINGYLDIQRIIPCINCLNQCKSHIEIIHPHTFQVFSNAAKSLERFCSINQYPRYPFLFDITLSCLQKSVKLNQSSISGSSHIGESALSTFSSVNYYNRKRANTVFYNEKLPSIHQMFIFSSNMVQLEPSLMNNPIESELLLRYFCKHTSSQNLSKNVNKIHNYILDIFRRLKSQKIKDYINKIDILIIDDREVQGYFAPGVMLLSEQSLKQSTIDIRCYYLIVRGLLGLLQLQKGNNIITIQNICKLNLSVFDKFQQFRNYLYIKNKKIKKIKEILMKKDNEIFVINYEGYFLKYYEKQLKFLIKEDIQKKITFQLNNLMLCFNRDKSEQFWQNFISNYHFLSPLIIEPLIKLALRQLTKPTKANLIQQLKASLQTSKYILSFYSNQEVSDELPKFINAQVYGLEERMTKIKVKQKFKDSIIERYQKYLPIKSNINQSQSMYLQFKKFNENKNFHHISILKNQIRRVIYFTNKYLQHQRVQLECSIVGWKLLSKLNLFPVNQQYYNLLKVMEGL